MKRQKRLTFDEHESIGSKLKEIYPYFSSTQIMGQQEKNETTAIKK